MKKIIVAIKNVKKKDAESNQKKLENFFKKKKELVLTILVNMRKFFHSHKSRFIKIPGIC